MWNAPLDVHGIHPRPGPVRIGRKVDQRAPIEHHRIGYARVVACYPFEPRAGGLNSPDVPVIRRHAANKIDEGIVGRPHRKVAMHPRRCHIDPAVPRAFPARARTTGRPVRSCGRRAACHRATNRTRRPPADTAAVDRRQSARPKIFTSPGCEPSARLVQIETSDESAEKPSVRISGLTRSRTSPCVRLR